MLHKNVAYAGAYAGKSKEEVEVLIARNYAA